eukprot:m.583448 g.583448  ORF g.583448 m.583448 type:complete len:199 (-) comp57956_c0_seq11:557-1153(-)
MTPSSIISSSLLRLLSAWNMRDYFLFQQQYSQSFSRLYVLSLSGALYTPVTEYERLRNMIKKDPIKIKTALEIADVNRTGTLTQYDMRRVLSASCFAFSDATFEKILEKIQGVSSRVVIENSISANEERVNISVLFTALELDSLLTPSAAIAAKLLTTTRDSFAQRVELSMLRARSGLHCAVQPSAEHWTTSFERLTS